MEADPLEKLLSVTIASKTLVDICKSKDKWFETCSTYLSSVLETIQKYQKSRNPSKKPPEACSLLLNEFEGFKSFLEKEQTRSSISSFFRGSSTMVREAQDLMRAIEKQIHNFNLAISVENQIETKENLERTQSLCTMTPSIKSFFVSEKAADMWVQHFFQDEQVSWSSFINAFRKFVVATEKLELTDGQLEAILTCMDEDHDRLIRYQEWDKFFESTWSKPFQRQQILKENAIIQTKSHIKVPPVVLRMTEVSDPKKYNYPTKHEFLISESKVRFLNYEGKEITLIKKWEREGIVVGRIKPSIYSPDIYFHHKVDTVSEKQFQIVLKKLIACNGFFVTNLSAGSPTALRIERIPYIISKGMLFDLVGTMLEVVEAVPNPGEDVNDDDPDLFFVNLNTKADEDHEDEAPTIKVRPGARKSKTSAQEEEEKESKRRTTKKKTNLPLPVLTLKIFQGKNINQNYTFELSSQKEQKIIKIGKEQTNEIYIEDLEEPVQMFIKWDTASKHWVAFSEVENKGESNSASLYLMHVDDYKRKNTAGTVSVKLRDGMKVAFGGNEMAVEIND